MFELKIAIMVFCATLFWWGGFSWKPARRFIMPSIITVACLLIAHTIQTHNWYQLTQLSCIGVFCLGYGDNSPLKHIFGNGWGRGVWGLLGALALSLDLFLSGHMVWYYFLGYLGLNFTFENALKNIPQAIGDTIIGIGFSSIIILIT